MAKLTDAQKGRLIRREGEWEARSQEVISEALKGVAFVLGEPVELVACLKSILTRVYSTAACDAFACIKDESFKGSDKEGAAL